MLFGEVSENFRPYSPITHRHAPEICQELGWDRTSFLFVPHLLPVNRGILSTIYVTFQHRVSAEEIDYVEAHGTATKLGDPIEVASLTKAFRAWTQRRGYCVIGSVKPNVGHLDRAAGVTGASASSSNASD